MDIWTAGLSTHIKNALRGEGFESKEEVIAAFNAGEIHCRNSGGGSTVPNLGKKGIIELRIWLGLPAIEAPAVKNRSLDWAIKYCESNGYTVTAN